MQQQQRFVLFLIISAALVFGWSYLFPPSQTPQPNKTSDSNVKRANQNLTQPSSSSTQPSTVDNSQTQNEATVAQLTPNNTPPRTLTITTPLYRVRVSSRGAVATSWIVKKNKDTERDLHSAGGTKQNPQSLELISQDGLKRQPDEAPLLLLTEDVALNTILAEKNYRLNGVEGEAGDININLAGNETRRVDFLLHDDAIGLDVTKGMVFSADRYNVGLAIDLKRGGQTLPAKILIGPSIGDQGVEHYSLYSVAPEGVAQVNNGIQRFLAQTIHSGEEGWLWFTSKRPEGENVKKVDGAIQWAGIGDTYFAMVAVPSKPLDGLEFRTAKYEHEANGKKEDRFLTTALVPIPADGSTSQLYVGPASL
jgi:YidC/Oxa1 family membrane protein insertase